MIWSIILGAARRAWFLLAFYTALAVAFGLWGNWSATALCTIIIGYVFSHRVHEDLIVELKGYVSEQESRL